MKSIFNEEEPIITVKEARKILGRKYKKIDDETIQKLVNELDEFVKIYLEFRTKRLQNS